MSAGASPVRVLAPDLTTTNLAAPGTAQFGQSIQASWAVRNIGSAAASGNWSDALYLSTTSNSLANATSLANLASPAIGLDAGAAYTNQVTVAMPLSTQLQPGAYFLVAVADLNNDQPESNEGNNLVSKAITLSLPPLLPPPRRKPAPLRNR